MLESLSKSHVASASSLGRFIAYGAAILVSRSVSGAVRLLELDSESAWLMALLTETML